MNLVDQYVIPSLWIKARQELSAYIWGYGYKITRSGWLKFAEMHKIELSAMTLIMEGRFETLKVYNLVTDHIREQTKGKVFG